MPDLDTMYAGGATGSMSRAAQIQALAASNAARLAASLVRPKAPPPPPRPAPQQGPRLPVDPRLSTAFSLAPRPIPGQVEGERGLLGLMSAQPQYGPLFDPQTGLPQVLAPGHVPTAIEVQPKPQPKTQVASKGIQQQAEGTGLKTSSALRSTITGMLDDVRHDPISDPNRRQAVEELATAFREGTLNKLFKKEDLLDNPLLHTINDISAWSRYRRMVSDWKASKNKTAGAEAVENPGDGTFSGLIDNGSFQSVTSPSSIAPYMVVRDESGLLTVVSAEQWIQGKFTDMKKDPKYAAQLITALAMTSAYGTDTAANNQRSRVALDREGNPVKAIVSNEDLTALKNFATEVVMWQNNGEEASADDALAELAKLGRTVSDQNTANGENGGGGGGGGRGGGGGGGGGAGSVRYTDPALLSAELDSIARTRMGTSLTPEQHDAFVQYYHQLEAQNSAAYFAGQSFTALDPQSQAIKWIQDHFQNESASHSYGQLASRFIQMMGSSNPFAGVS